MAFPSLLPVSSVSQVTAGGTTTIRPGVTGTYFALRMRYTRSGVAATPAQIASDILLIKVLLDGVTQWEITGAQLQMINAKNGISPDNGEIPLWFTEPFRITETVKDAYAWGMADIKDFTVEVTIDSGATSPGLTVFKYWTVNGSVSGEIRKLRKSTVPITLVGDNVFTDWRPRNRVLGYHFNSAIVTNVRVKAAEQEMINAPVSELHSTLKEQGFTPQSGWVHVSFDGRNRAGEGFQPFILSDAVTSNGVIKNAIFPIVADLTNEITITTSAATPFTKIDELRGPRD